MISIKSEREIELLEKAGHVVYLTHCYLKPYIKPGITTKELDKLMQITAYNDVTNIICEDEIPCNFKVDAKISKIKKLIEKENANV